MMSLSCKHNQLWCCSHFSTSLLICSSYSFYLNCYYAFPLFLSQFSIWKLSGGYHGQMKIFKQSTEHMIILDCIRSILGRIKCVVPVKLRGWQIQKFSMWIDPQGAFKEKINTEILRGSFIFILINSLTECVPKFTL